MLSVEDWAEIRRLYRAEGLPIKVIARVLGISKNTVKAALASDSPPKYERLQRGSIVDEVEPQIRELLQAYPRMPATVIAERIGWTRSIRVSRRGLPSCGRCICHRIQPHARPMPPGRSPSATSGSPTSRSPPGSARPAPRPGCRC
jgi:hypothetical protein